MYLNVASTTAPNKNVLDDFLWCAENHWYNPSDVSQDALNTKQIIHNAQEQIAKSINAKANEIVFTSGGTESNNWAIKGYLDANPDVDTIITTEIEHSSVYNVCKYLETKGYKIYYAPVDAYDGIVDTYKLQKIIQDNNITNPFVSIMLVNNEIGTIQPIKEISKIVKSVGGVLHTDAVQAYMHMNIDVQDLGVDLMSTSFHKFGGLKNSGFLYIREGIELTPLLHGGHQFEARRSGTENVPAIYAMGRQVERLSEELDVTREYDMEMERYFIKKIYEKHEGACEEIFLNGHPTKRLPTTLSFTFMGINADALITLLDMKEIQISAGSACEAYTSMPSRVLKAIGLTDEEAKSTIRISFDARTINEQIIDDFTDTLSKCIKKLKMVVD